MGIQDAAEGAREMTAGAEAIREMVTSLREIRPGASQNRTMVSQVLPQVRKILLPVAGERVHLKVLPVKP